MKVILKGTEPTRTLYSVLYSFDIDEDDETCCYIDHLKEEGEINPLNIPCRFIEKLIDENTISVDDILIDRYRWTIFYE